MGKENLMSKEGRSRVKGLVEQYEKNLKEGSQDVKAQNLRVFKKEKIVVANVLITDKEKTVKYYDCIYSFDMLGL
jgi:hypothetical protein